MVHRTAIRKLRFKFHPSKKLLEELNARAKRVSGYYSVISLHMASETVMCKEDLDRSVKYFNEVLKTVKAGENKFDFAFALTMAKNSAKLAIKQRVPYIPKQDFSVTSFWVSNVKSEIIENPISNEQKYVYDFIYDGEIYTLKGAGCRLSDSNKKLKIVQFNNKWFIEISWIKESKDNAELKH